MFERINLRAPNFVWYRNTIHEALSCGMKNLPLKGHGLGHVMVFQILGPPIYLRNG